MKALSVQQPWATIICSGLKDVENRTRALKTLPIRVLIHAGAKRQSINEDNQFEWVADPCVWAIENYKTMGILPEKYKEFPVSAVVGVATIDRCIDDSTSIWAQNAPGEIYQWVMKDVKLFKEPILGVKGSLGIFEIPDIDENNLPEFAEIPRIERNGDKLRIPVNKQIFDSIKSGEQNSFEFFVTDSNVDLFADAKSENFDGLPTKQITFFCGNEEIIKEPKVYAIAFSPDDEGNIYEYEDFFGRIYNEVFTVIEF